MAGQVRAFEASRSSAISRDEHFCGECGIQLVSEGFTPRCGSCGFARRRFPTVGVALVARDERGGVLLGRRTHGTFAGLWCIPCGRLEWDEDVRIGAEREFAEETGLIATAGKVVAVHSNFHVPERQTVGVWFEAIISGGELCCADGEFTELAYFDPASPPPLAFPTDALVLAQLAEENRTGGQGQ